MNILLTSLFKEADPIISVAVKYSINKLVIFHQKEFPNKDAEKSFKKAKDKLKSFFSAPNFELKFIPIKNVYDIYEVAKYFTSFLDKCNMNDDIYLNITGGRKTLSLGLLFGAYARNKHIKEILYVIEETGNIIILPKLDFDVNASDLKVLKTLEEWNKKNKPLTITDFAKTVGLSRAMIYRIFTELETKGYIKGDQKKFTLTDSGRIVLLK